MESKQETYEGSTSKSPRSATKLSIKSLIDPESDTDTSPSRPSPSKRTIRTDWDEEPEAVSEASRPNTPVKVSPSLTVRLRMEEPPVVSVPAAKSRRLRSSLSRSGEREAKRRHSQRLSRNGEELTVDKTKFPSPDKSPLVSSSHGVLSTSVPTNKIRIRLRPSNETIPSENESSSKPASIKDESIAVKRGSPRTSPSRKEKNITRKSLRRASLTTTISPSPRSPGGKRKKLPTPKAAVEEEGKEEKVKEPLPKKESPKRLKVVAEPTAVPPSSPHSIVNNEFCSACSGAGTLICCESCPKSFHFLCADPPIDPDNVPGERWFCNECQSTRNVSDEERGGKFRPVKNVKEVWNRLKEFVDRLNPKAFTLPKRIRKIATEEEAISRQEERGVEGKIRPLNTNRISTKHGGHIDGRSIGKDRLSANGYCHYCGGGSGMEENKLLINCDDCSLKWHLDCLPYPLAVYPSSHHHWSCPVHLTKANLSHLPPQTVQQILKLSKTSIQITDWPEKQLNSDHPILPESSVRLQFGWSTNGLVRAEGNYLGSSVPQTVKDTYELMRKTSAHEAKRLLYYENYSYADLSVETNLVI